MPTIDVTIEIPEEMYASTTLEELLESMVRDTNVTITARFPDGEIKLAAEVLGIRLPEDQKSTEPRRIVADIYINSINGMHITEGEVSSFYQIIYVPGQPTVIQQRQHSRQ